MERSLKARLVAQISANGPISIADYMSVALGDPELGYYINRDPFGADGDFITAPEISQMFGELIGAWFYNAWQQLGAPTQFSMAELGPGRGTLMMDILRATRLRPEFAEAIHIHLVETSPQLRKLQRDRLSEFSVPCTWHDGVADLPDAPLFCVANEFFDALPIHQYVFNEGVWRERVIGLSDDQELAFGLGAACFSGPAPMAAPGDIIEVSPASLSVISEVALRIVEQGGAGLVIDYGHTGSNLGDTFQAVRSHKFAEPLDNPGEADLTAHVNFQALANSARNTGAIIHGPISQADFLLGLGLLERAGQLGAATDAARRRQITEDVDRLAGADQMGTLFKVMAISAQKVVLPPFKT